MSKMPFMKLFVADYLGDTQHLTTEQHGAYLLVLMSMWANAGSLPDDPKVLARVARVSPKRWGQISPEIMAFLDVEDGVVTQKRLVSELQKAEQITQKRKTVGEIGNQAKSLKKRDGVLAIANANANANGVHSLDAIAQKVHGRTQTELYPDPPFTHSEPNGSDAKAASPARQVSVGADLFGGVIEAPRRQAVVIPFDRTAAAVGKSPAPVPAVFEAKAETPAVAPTEPKSGNPMKDALWRVGKAYLASCDVPAAKAGQMIGKWLKTLRDDHGALLTILVKAEEIRPVDPISWISGAVSSRVRRSEAEPERKTINGIDYVRDPADPSKWIADLGA